MYQDAATELIKFFGKAGTFIKVTSGEYDIDSASSTKVRTNYTVTLAKSLPRFNERNSPNLINTEASVFYMSNKDAVSFTPEVGDELIFESQTYRILSLMQQRGENANLAGWRFMTERG